MSPTVDGRDTLDRGRQLAGEPFDVGRDFVLWLVGQAEQHLGHAEVGPAGQLVRIGFEVEGDDLWGRRRGLPRPRCPAAA